MPPPDMPPAPANPPDPASPVELDALDELDELVADELAVVELGTWFGSREQAKAKKAGTMKVGPRWRRESMGEIPPNEDFREVFGDVKPSSGSFDVFELGAGRDMFFGEI